MVRPSVLKMCSPDMEDGSTALKKSRTVDKEWYPNLGVGWVANNRSLRHYASGLDSFGMWLGVRVSDVSSNSNQDLVRHSLDYTVSGGGTSVGKPEREGPPDRIILKWILTKWSQKYTECSNEPSGSTYDCKIFDGVTVHFSIRFYELELISYWIKTTVISCICEELTESIRRLVTRSHYWLWLQKYIRVKTFRCDTKQEVMSTPTLGRLQTSVTQNTATGVRPFSNECLTLCASNCFLYRTDMATASLSMLALSTIKEEQACETP